MRLHHVQVSMPRGEEELARRFYGGAVGLTEVDKPEDLAGRGGCWFRAFDGDAVVAEIHGGVDEPFRPARRAHPALVVDSLAELEAMAERIEGGGVELSWAERATVAGYLRFHARDGVGNRLEVLTPRWPARNVHLGSIESAGSPSTVQAMRLLLVRHGQTSNNVAGALDTAFPGAGLTELGHAQARALPNALRHGRIAGIHVSHLICTHETASPLASTLGTPLQITEALEEIAAGDFEMRRDKEAVDANQDNQSRWAGKALGHALPGGEDGRRFWARYAGALRQIAGYYTDDATVAV